MDERKTFLLEMYRQMFADINRHMTVVWQSVGVVVGAFAVFALVEKEIISIDLAVSLVLMLCAWLYAHMLDAAYWYNRNLAIISNIEKQFLVETDLRNIHYYFGGHWSKKNRMITQFRIQAALGVGIASLVMLFHFSSRVLPGFGAEWELFQPERTLPYLTSLGAVGFCVWLTRDRRLAYVNFVANSPGIHIETSSVEYGVGHRTDEAEG